VHVHVGKHARKGTTKEMGCLAAKKN